MRNFTRLFSYFLLCLFPCFGLANTIIVKGNIKYSNGQPAVNKQVRIKTDSIAGVACVQNRIVYTNPNGYYIDTISCSNTFTSLMLTVENCNGQLLSSVKQVPANSNYIETNFTLCLPDSIAPNTPCKAAISFEKIAGRTFRFSSKNSVVAAGDSIIVRKWVFGDGTVLEGKEISPLKEFKDTGVFNVCLGIQSKKGCQSYACITIIVRDSTPPPPINCQTKFSFRIEGKKVIFNTANSAQYNDSLVRYKWVLGDGSVVENKSKEWFYQYAKAGKYQVCLSTKTASGCESQYCATIEITEPIACRAAYTIEKTGIKSFRFNSTKAEVASGDTIKQRIWIFGDGTSMDGNEISPLKTYNDTGVYTVCLKIKSNRGCEAMYCGTIVIKDSTTTNPPLYCKAFFSVERKEKSFQFNSQNASAPQGDSIISRTWYFGDNSNPLTGNRKDPVYQYQQSGTYTVCLVVKTSKGCESRYCTTVQYLVPNTQCAARFSEERLAQKKIRFNSNIALALTGDSIVERKWKFGDGTELNGNVIAPEKEYRQKGIYTVCLKIKTAAGCQSEICKVFEIKDSTANETNSQRIKIIQINPNPVVNRFVTTIWTKMGIEVEIGIYDIYGTIKWKTKKGLLTGNNFIEIPAIELKTGPYFLRVVSAIGRDSRIFYKL